MVVLNKIYTRTGDGGQTPVWRPARACPRATRGSRPMAPSTS